MVLGPGLVINTVLKTTGETPAGRGSKLRRIREISARLGTGNAGTRQVFPSGHAAVGFFLFSPFFFLRNSSKKWAWFFLLLGLSYGTYMGIAEWRREGILPPMFSGGRTDLSDGLDALYVFRFDKK